MTVEEARNFMKGYFERLYDKLKNISPDVVSMCDLPEDMMAEGSDPDEEYNVWKLIPSTVTDADIAKKEEECGLKFPNVLKAFLSTYHHAFEAPIGRNMSDAPFFGLDNAFNPQLAAKGYLPFTWDGDGYYIRCIDLNANEDKDNCPIVEFDHEALFDTLDNNSEISKEQLAELASPVADNLCDYLNGICDAI